MSKVVAGAVLAATLFWLGLVLGGMAKAQQCAPLAVVLTQAGMSAPIEGVVKLDDEQAARVVKWFNSIPPESEETWNAGWVVRFVGGGMGLMLGDKAAQTVCFASMVPPTEVDKLMRVIEGGDPA